MDTIRITTHELFTVKILHSGYGGPRPNMVSEDITLQPDEGTKALFKNYSMGHRFFNDRLICFVRSDRVAPPANEPQVPYLLFSGDDRIRFMITVTTDFLSKTVVDATGSDQIYMFNNRTNVGTNLFISHSEATVNADDLEDAAIVGSEKPSFAVIDIFMNGTTASYDLFTPATQQLRNPAYKIQFDSVI